MMNENPVTRYRSRKSLTIDGSMAHWYARTTRKNMEQYKSWAQKVSGYLRPGAHVLEIAPGPGYLDRWTSARETRAGCPCKTITSTSLSAPPLSRTFRIRCRFPTKSSGS